jgi:hypothetical protein
MIVLVFKPRSGEDVESLFSSCVRVVHIAAPALVSFLFISFFQELEGGGDNASYLMEINKKGSDPCIVFQEPCRPVVTTFVVHRKHGFYCC